MATFVDGPDSNPLLLFVESFCALEKREEYFYHSWMRCISSFPAHPLRYFFSPVVLHLLWYPSNILLGFKRLCKRYESFQQTLVHVRRANEASRYQMCLSPSLIPRKKKKTMPFLTVDTIIGNQAFRNGRCHTCSRLGLD